MKPTYQAFVFDEIRRIGRAWYAANPDTDRSDMEFMFEKIGEMCWRRLVDEKPMRQIFQEIGVNPDDYAAIPPAQPPVGDGGQVDALTPSGPIFRVNGQPWRWVGCTAFALPQLYTDGENIDGFLDWAIRTGFNTLRCFTGYANIPQQMGRQPFLITPDQLHRFLTHVCEDRELRVELTCGDLQLILPEHNAQRDWMLALGAVAGQFTGVTVERCNEPFKNGVDVVRMGRIGPNVQASGNYDFDNPAPVLDYLTFHSERKAEWPRTAKDGQDFYEKWKVPVVLDEPMGADETLKPWSRSNVPDDFFDYGATAALNSAGATFHATDLVYGRVPGPIQQQCAEAFVAGLHSVSLEAPLGNYTRGYLSECPLEHDDATALRTFARILGNRAVCAAVRPTSAWRAVARNGWRIIQQLGPSDRVVYLER